LFWDICEVRLRNFNWLTFTPLVVFSGTTAVNEEEFDQFNEISSFIISMIKPRIPSPTKLHICTTATMKKSKNLKNQDHNEK
jgi:hypothetical protein